MSRPKPTVLLETIDKKTYKADPSFKSRSYLGSVLFARCSFNLKSSKHFNKLSGFKYKKVSFLQFDMH